MNNPIVVSIRDFLNSCGIAYDCLDYRSFGDDHMIYVYGLSSVRCVILIVGCVVEIYKNYVFGRGIDGSEINQPL